MIALWRAGESIKLEDDIKEVSRGTIKPTSSTFQPVIYGANLFPDEAWAERHSVSILPTNEFITMGNILTIHISVIEGKEFVLDREAILV